MIEAQRFESRSAQQEQQPSRFASLLRSPEEMDRLSREAKGWPKYQREYVRPESGQKITLYGDEHYFNAESAKPFDKAFDNATPDLLLIEGSTLDQDISPAMNGEEVLKLYGEQGYAVWKAKQRGIEVATWDLPLEDRMAKAAETHAPEAVAGWVLGQAAKHMMKQQMPLTADAFSKFISQVSPKMMMGLLELGISIDEESFDAITTRYVGKRFSELDAGSAEQLAGPQFDGETNKVIRDMNAARDTHALEVMERLGKTHKNIFVTAGNGHVVTWEPAVEKMYAMKS